MNSWWMRPLIRVAAALLLPVLVPLSMTWLLWSLPGEPIDRLGLSDSLGRQVAAERRNLDQGPWHFFDTWLEGAIHGDFGTSWSMMGLDIYTELIQPAVFPTLFLVTMALVPMALGTIGAATRLIPGQVDGLLHFIGLIPAVVFGVIATGWIEVNYGARDITQEMEIFDIQILLGGLILGFSDGAFSGAVSGARSLFSSERKRRYVGIGILRGEGVLSNTLPNVLPALSGQLRARTLHILSGTVVVEVILKIDGLGDLLWRGAYEQDFPLVLATATCFAIISSFLLLAQSLVEIGVAWHVRRAPVIPEREAVG